MTPRVWHLLSNRWNSAVTEYALMAASALQQLGWPSLFSPLAERPAERRARELGLPVAAVPHFQPTPPLCYELWRQKRAFRPDVLMVYGGPETVLARLVGGRRPLVRFRGQLKDLATDPHSARERLGRQGLSTILAPSEVVAHTLRRPKGPPVRVIPLGCDTQKFYFDAEAFAALARPTLKILGRFDPVKGHRPFFGWFRQILRSWPQAIPPPYLEVVGEPANISREQLRGFARAAGLREGQDWRLLDRRFETMAPILSGTHVGVICSQDSEVICRVAEEFLLAGCPLFVSGVGSLEECLFDATAGVSYRELTPAEAIKSLKRLLIAAFQETAPIRRARAEAARQYFSTTMMGQNLARLVTELLSDRRRS